MMDFADEGEKVNVGLKDDFTTGINVGADVFGLSVGIKLTAAVGGITTGVNVGLLDGGDDGDADPPIELVNVKLGNRLTSP